MANHTLCQIDDIPENSSKGFCLHDENVTEATIFVVKHQHALYAYLNRCPHLGLPLEWMPHQFLDREGHYIQCATHGALFAITSGKCVAGPCLDESLVAIPFEIQEKSIIINAIDLEAIHLEKKL